MSYVSELYRVAVEGNVYTWTSGNAPFTHDSEVYEPVTIGRTADEQNSDISRSNVTVRVALDNPLIQYYLNAITDFVATVTIFRKTEQDAVFTYWKGRVTGFKINVNEAQIECESVFTSLRKTGLRAKYQKPCRFALYHRGCGLNAEDFRLTTNVISVDGATITTDSASSQADGWYNGGMIRGPDGSYRWILNHVGDVLTLQRPYDALELFIGLSVGYGNDYGNYYGGASISIYPGCDRTLTTCINKFDNVEAQGGFKWIPDKNPFDGSLYGGGGGSSPVTSALQRFRNSVRIRS